jgi:hypothetical protein
MTRLTKTIKTKLQEVEKRGLRAVLFDSYKPELHYMRGPGPAWKEKHGSLQPYDGRDSRLAVAPSSVQTRVPPDTLSASRR